VFIFLATGEKGSGTFVELGAAIESNLSSGRPKIYIIGESNADSMFFFHPSVRRVKKVEDVLSEL
jgi:hypothetical protein